MLTPDELLPYALRAAVRASEVIMDIYTSAEDIGIRTKDDDSPVTRADMASNEAIINELAQTGIPILSEESEHEPYESRKSHPQMWVVDPLDGTKEFIKRNDMFAVCIALVEANKATLGVVAVPATGAIYYTRNGKACRSQMANGGIDATAETTLPVTYGPVPHIVTGSVSHVSASHEVFLQKLREVWPDAITLSVGSAIKQCMLAEGSAALYPRFGMTAVNGSDTHWHGTKEWDTAAGQAIIEAAGGQVLLVPSMKPMTYNRMELLNPPFIAAAPGVPHNVLSHVCNQ